MKKKEFLEKIAKLDTAGLQNELHAKADEILKLRIRHASNQLETPHRVRAERKNYARILTQRNKKSDSKGK